MAKKTRAEILSAPEPPSPPLPDLLSTGCALFDAALGGGVPKGAYLRLVGDSGSSKTWFTFCMFAQASLDRRFDGYSFVFDNAENGALMDVDRYFGRRVRERLTAPSKRADGSATVEEFYMNVEANVRRGPCIYVLDSMDALNAQAEEDNFEAKLHYHQTEKGKDKIKGSMGMGKAKANSGHICRIANATLRSNGSILVVVSQTRDMLNASVPGMRTSSGGRALKFFAHIEAWTKVRKPLVKTYHGKDREYGAVIQIDVQKNRVTGWEGKVPDVDFIKGYGIDDVGSSVNYLLDERHWGAAEPEKPAKGKRPPVDDDADGEKAPKRFAAPEFDFAGTKDQLVKKIETEGREGELRALVRTVWDEIAAAVRPARKNPYTAEDSDEPKG